MKISSCAILGGESYSIQKKMLDRYVDVVVASPGRLLQHKLQGNVMFNHVSHVVIDEVDTMFTQGFGPEIRGILRAVVSKTPKVTDKVTKSKKPVIIKTGIDIEDVKFNEFDFNEQLESVDDQIDTSELVDTDNTAVKSELSSNTAKKLDYVNPRQNKQPQMIFATATLTKAVKTLLQELSGVKTTTMSDVSSETNQVAVFDVDFPGLQYFFEF